MRYMSLCYFSAPDADPDCEVGEDRRPTTHLMPPVIGAARNGNSFVGIFAVDDEAKDRTAVRDYAHPCDLATAPFKTVDRFVAPGTSAIINPETGPGHVIRDVIAPIEMAGHGTVRLVEDGCQPGDLPASNAGRQ